MKVAIYDLSHMPTTFDFAVWAINAKSHGAEHVHFIADKGMTDKKYSQELGWRRFGNILVPLCKLAGLTFSVGGKRDGAEYTYKAGDLCEFYAENGWIAKLKTSTSVKETGYVTITIRNSFRNKWRNSNLAAWDSFAKHLESEGRNVVVLDECELSPLDVGYRMALYANADMNYGVSNGPVILCHLSDAPYITININPVNNTGKGYTIEGIMNWHKFPIGSQYNFRNERQILVYEPDTFENILRAHKAMMVGIKHQEAA